MLQLLDTYLLHHVPDTFPSHKGRFIGTSYLSRNLASSYDTFPVVVVVVVVAVTAAIR